MDGSLGGKSELLNLLGDVKARVQDKLGVVEFPLPQFILIGRQSVGKSRLIEALAGETFNFVSGALGSRRPTVLEFCNVATVEKTHWFVRNMQTMSWEEKPVSEVMEIVGSKHEELGEDVSSDPVFVRIESPGCVDMQIVDLPGFRDFSVDSAKQGLAKKIEELDETFMADERNVILCVEQCGDAANMSSLQRARKFDSKFERTILIRNKLDKYYSDLSSDNASAWVDGHGDLPDSLVRFALTLPFWKDESKPGSKPDKPFQELTQEKNKQDLATLGDKGLSPAQLKTIGFNSFVAYMETRIEKMFVASVGPVLTKLKDLKASGAAKKKVLEDEKKNTKPGDMEALTRACGNSFALALNDFMEGDLETKICWSLEEELTDFHQAYDNDERIVKLPGTDFSGLRDYLDYLTEEAELFACDLQLNGGPQFKRMMHEVEIFLRFSEVAGNTKKKDVIQARGVSMTSLTWRDVVVKLLSHEAHEPLKRRLQYVGERIRFFFSLQKDCVLEYMGTLKDRSMHADAVTTHYNLITGNEMIKHLIFETFDAACTRQLKSFMALFSDMLTATFTNPWVFMKGATEEGAEDEDDEGPEPGQLRERIPAEIQTRSGTEGIISFWLNEIPTESNLIDDAVERVQMLVLKTYSFIRSHICDQVEMLTDTFFKFPMLKKLPDDMQKIVLSPDDLLNYQMRRETLGEQLQYQETLVSEVGDCVAKIQDFKMRQDVKATTSMRG